MPRFVIEREIPGAGKLSAAEIQAIAAIIRDETRRWAEERALRQRLAELEESKG